jgi:glycosyltransferase involved in cell wall biosynthesis
MSARAQCRLNQQTLRVTLIVTTYNWPAALDLTLRSVARQSAAPTEIIVADDGSGPETRAVVARWQERLKTPVVHMWQPDEGFRLARSRNRAIVAARGDYVIIVDGDLVLHRHFIADHARAARHGCFIQGVRLLTGPTAAGRMLERGMLDLGFFAPGIKRRRHTVRSLLLSRLVFRERTGQRAIRGCNQAYWKSDLVRVNGFNEAFEGWGREDNEIAARLYNAGIQRRNLKFQALAIHLHHPLRHSEVGVRNDALLQSTIRERKAWCPLGLSLHVEPAIAGACQPEPRGAGSIACRPEPRDAGSMQPESVRPGTVRPQVAAARGEFA